MAPGTDCGSAWRRSGRCCSPNDGSNWQPNMPPKHRKLDEFARRKQEAKEKRAVELKRIEEAIEAARLKEEERQRQIAQQKEEAEAKRQAILKQKEEAAALEKGSLQNSQTK
jgi:hypothetical protein